MGSYFAMRWRAEVYWWRWELVSGGIWEGDPKLGMRSWNTKKIINGIQGVVTKWTTVRAKDASFDQIFPCQFFFVPKEPWKKVNFGESKGELDEFQEFLLREGVFFCLKNLKFQRNSVFHCLPPPRLGRESDLNWSTTWNMGKKGVL